MGKISIIMPAYNSSKTIEASIKSVICQSYKDWELIVIDDCSKDGTVDLVNGIIDKNKEFDIKLYRNKENKGVAYSRNYGVKVAAGDLIAFLDSDDLWVQDKLEKQVMLYERQNSPQVLLFTGSSFITAKSEIIDFTLKVPTKIGRKDLQKQNIISCSSVLASKELLLKHEFPITNVPIHEDFVVWIEILKEIPYAYGIDEPLLIYRVSDNSKSSKKSKAAVMNWNTYRYVGLGFLERIYYMMCYTIRGLKKWSKIKAQNKK
ncbi:Glycosyl transferase family 2 [Oribacterium sp. KHPX15]|uniref:glycosyltransferase family 2 protein n=1 Tax=Oribacterium sp. KHPX15 TaxID=1855342 RepID=UPI000898716E|nr:glycosyltransferase [Oribacterium sp. KHPX15]SEA56925.1 Glycosyl transferase family 2 [Oribacterium sp. KHPX15]